MPEHARSRFGRSLAILSGLLCFAVPVAADLIRFKDGSTFRGTIVKKTEREVIVQFDFGTMSFNPEDILAVEAEPEPATAPARITLPATSPTPTSQETGSLSKAPAQPVPADAIPGVTLPLALKAGAFIRMEMNDGSQGTASGTIISPRGTILTNYRVVENAKRIVVTLQEDKEQRYKEPKEYEAQVIKTNTYYDLALITIHATTPSHLRFADDGAVKVGNEVRAIGNPFGLQATVSRGIISAVRTNRGLEAQYVTVPGDSISEREFEDITWIQTDAAINPGNSGGPLLDDKHEIVGINTFGYQPAGNVGLNFASHVKLLRKFAAGYYKP